MGEVGELYEVSHTTDISVNMGEEDIEWEEEEDQIFRLVIKKISWSL